MRAIGRAFIVFSFAMVVGLGPAAMSAETDSAKPDAAKPPAAKSAAKPDAPLAYISVAGAPGDENRRLPRHSASGCPPPA
jgi:hypothetical protein